MDAGNFAVVSRSFAAAREVGACADDAAPFRGAAPADVAEACLRSLDAHAATERLGALDDFVVYSASDVIDRADADGSVEQHAMTPLTRAAGGNFLTSTSKKRTETRKLFWTR